MPITFFTNLTNKLTNAAIFVSTSRGKFGEVKRCREYKTGRQLAAKFIEVGGIQDRKDILNEVDVMMSLQHPGLLQLYDAFERKGKFCLVMEL